MTSIKINRVTQITTSGNETLLNAMERAGLEPEYHCRDGHCGACRCKLVSGEVEQVGFAMAYTHGDEILPCICKAKGDVQLEAVRYQAARATA
ncbi:class I ribonucleotide reductase maintenance protein YfaE [Vibrio sp. WXL103]|uniref:class I ribonucleotide reductase maintenance protein YfaE n=1 Tax=unclassified Vibrio TaxID=2614977 RepID=UPI003EC8C33D